MCREPSSTWRCPLPCVCPPCPVCALPALCALVLTPDAVSQDPLAPDDIELQGINWAKFVKDDPPHKSEPKRACLSWVQTKLSQLGAATAVAVTISDPNPPVSMAAFRFGMSLLEHGNLDAQNSLLDFLQQTQCETFFKTLSTKIQKMQAVVKEWQRVTRHRMDQAVRATRRAGGGAEAVAAASMDPMKDPFRNQINDSKLVLRFIQVSSALPRTCKKKEKKEK